MSFLIWPAGALNAPLCHLCLSCRGRWAMTRAEVKAEEEREKAEKNRLRSKLREGWESGDDEVARPIDKLWMVLGILSFLNFIACMFNLVPWWTIWALSLATAISAWKKIPVRYRNMSEFERYQLKAEKIDYMLCPDCAHDLRGIDVVEGKLICPECGREVAVAELKEIWT